MLYNVLFTTYTLKIYSVYYLYLQKIFYIKRGSMKHSVFFLLSGNTNLATFSNSFYSVTLTLMAEMFTPYFHLLNIISTGAYFITDLFVGKEMNLIFITHHMLAIYSFLLTFTIPLIDDIDICTLIIRSSRIACLTEVSGLFLAPLQEHLIPSSFPLPTWYSKKVAGITFIIIFFLFRFVALPLYLLSLPNDLYLMMNYPTMFGLYSLSVYWFFLLIQGAIKELKI